MATGTSKTQYWRFSEQNNALLDISLPSLTWERQRLRDNFYYLWFEPELSPLSSVATLNFPIHHLFHISHNTPCLPIPPPPKKKEKRKLLFLGTTVIPRRNNKQRLCKVFGGQARCIMGDVQTANGKPLGYDTMLYLTWLPRIMAK